MKRGALATVLGGVVAALAWPAALLSATDFIDSKWSVAIDRSRSFPIGCSLSSFLFPPKNLWSCKDVD